MMTMTITLERIWAELNPGKEEEVFKLIDDAHPLKIYAGLNHLHQQILLLVSSCEPPKIPVSQSIHVTIAQRHDGRWAMKMILINSDLGQLFSMLCTDLVQFTHQNGMENDLVLRFHYRYIKWMNLLERTGSGLLDKRTLRGLIGELMVLKRLILTYGRDDAINAWVGPLAVHQDFHFGHRWFEVKTVRTGTADVKVSSIEQLDVLDYPGIFVVVELDSATGYEPFSFSIVELIMEVRGLLDSPAARLNFEDKLLDLGYTDRQEYEDLYFTAGQVRYFEVTANFPCLRRHEIPAGIKNATYQLSIESLRNFERLESEVFTHGAAGVSEGSY